MGNHSVRDRRAEIRAYMAEHQVNYTTAKRAVELRISQQPPVLIPITSTWCDPGCDGSPHPGATCRTWYPFLHSRPVGAFDVCQAAALPGDRVRSLCHRFTDGRQFGAGGIAPTWLLALIYAMLLDEQPELAPDPRRLRDAVNAGDLSAVDMLMQPLDRAAVDLVHPDTDRWWNATHPRLTAFAARVLDDPATQEDTQPWDVTVLEHRNRVTTLAQRWEQAQKERRNWHGYLEREALVWNMLKDPLDAVLLAQAGGHARDTPVDVDGRRMRIILPIWGPAGPPVAYDVKPVDAPVHNFDLERCDAASCRGDAAHAAE
ncbi:hypothetical protein ABJI51_16890 [Amycolatopsis sp. NEAU-NG30]|uniref:Uncharacterized protein n=1 Tax=Amycolatopsis melonis TaxID=3156488 RepID=A0ABV0LEN8_9PSEU